MAGLFNTTIVGKTLTIPMSVSIGPLFSLHEIPYFLGL